MKIACVIVSYNSSQDIELLLKSMTQLSQKPDSIILVDNKSSSQDVENLIKLSRKYNTELVLSEKNGGFAHGSNQGIIKALELGATHIGLINPDATIEDSKFIEKIQYAFEKSNYGIIGTYVMSLKDKKIEFGGAKLGFWTLYPKILHRGDTLQNIYQQSSLPSITDYTTGSSLFFTREVFESLKGMDESYFMYFEETDFCLQSRKKGYEIGILSNTYILHNTSNSVGRMSWFYVKYMIRNFLKFAWKNGKWYQIPGFLGVYCFFWVPGFLFKYIIENNKKIWK